MASLNTILSWFQTRDKPTQQQFEEAWRSFWHKDDQMPVSNVTGLQNTLNNLQLQINNLTGGTGSAFVLVGSGVTLYDVPAGTLVEKIILLSDADMALKIGTTAGAQDVLEETYLPDTAVVTLDRYFAAATTIHFSGVSNATVKKIFIR